MNFVCFQIDKIQMILSEFLQPAQIFVAHGVTLLKCRTLEFTGADFGYVMGQFHAHRIF